MILSTSEKRWVGALARMQRLKRNKQRSLIFAILLLIDG